MKRQKEKDPASTEVSAWWEEGFIGACWEKQGLSVVVLICTLVVPTLRMKRRGHEVKAISGSYSETLSQIGAREER